MCSCAPISDGVLFPAVGETSAVLLKTDLKGGIVTQNECGESYRMVSDGGSSAVAIDTNWQVYWIFAGSGGLTARYIAPTDTALEQRPVRFSSDGNGGFYLNNYSDGRLLYCTAN